ncbi:MAG: tocopherol cyclase family protein [Clostridiaceae bacterium]
MKNIWYEKLINPEYFQGNKDKTSYFEGWYFKQVSSNNKCVLSLIPGISLDKSDKHAFIQVIIAPAMKTYYFRFSIEEFLYSEDKFQIKIGNNTFSKNKVKLDINDGDVSIKGSLNFTNMKKIKRTIWMPNIMGPFGYLTFMECNHGVISMEHKVEGSLKINNESLDFDKTKGYIEKDWGSSFPKNYIWLQCNDFSNDDFSFMFSLAEIPFMGFSFNGFLCNIQIGDKEYRFASYTGAKAEILSYSGTKIEILVRSFKYKLYITAESENSGDLLAPAQGKMINTIKEGIEGKIQIKLRDKNNRSIINTKGENAGIELVNVDFIK